MRQTTFLNITCCLESHKEKNKHNIKRQKEYAKNVAFSSMSFIHNMMLQQMWHSIVFKHCVVWKHAITVATALLVTERK